MKIPTRQEIEVLPADEPKSIKLSIYDRIIITSSGVLDVLPAIKPFKLGWTIRETIGVAVVNARGITAGNKSIIIG